MTLKLTNPLVFFDLETTGTNVDENRIVQISLLKLFPNSHEELEIYLVNTGIPIHEDASVVHGITVISMMNIS